MELIRKLEDKRAKFDKTNQTYQLYNTQNQLVSWTDMKSKIEKSGRIDPIEILLIKQYEINNKEKIHNQCYTLLHLCVESIYLSKKLNSDLNIHVQSYPYLPLSTILLSSKKTDVRKYLLPITFDI